MYMKYWYRAEAPYNKNGSYYLKLACFLLYEYFVIRDFHNFTKAIYSLSRPTPKLEHTPVNPVDLKRLSSCADCMFWVNKIISFMKKNVWTQWLWVFLFRHNEELMLMNSFQ
jgi:hypothetical protein